MNIHGPLFFFYGPPVLLIFISSVSIFRKLPWRNWLARSAVNRKVGGSSPPGSGFNLLSLIYLDFGAEFLCLLVKLQDNKKFLTLI